MLGDPPVAAAETPAAETDGLSPLRFLTFPDGKSEEIIRVPPIERLFDWLTPTNSIDEGRALAEKIRRAYMFMDLDAYVVVPDDVERVMYSKWVTTERPWDTRYANRPLVYEVAAFGPLVRCQTLGPWWRPMLTDHSGRWSTKNLDHALDFVTALNMARTVRLNRQQT